MSEHPLLDHWIKEAPGAVILGVFLLHVILSMPKPGVRWNWETVYAWAFRALTSFALMIQAILPRFLGGKGGKR